MGAQPAEDAGSNATERSYVLGPEGTFSDRAAAAFAQHRLAAGQGAPQIVYTTSIEDAVQGAAGDPAAVAIVPIENSETGTVVLTQEELRAAPVAIEWEVSLPVRYTLVGNGPLDTIARVFCHPVAHGQCSRFLRAKLPLAEVHFASSNAQAGAELKALGSRVPAAAIVPSHLIGAQLSNRPLAVDIQNSETNTTRFVVVRSKQSAGPPDFRHHKTSIVVVPNLDRPGLLAELLSALARRDINITRIESRPSRERPWAYVFFLDLNNNDRVPDALDEMRAHGDEVIILGTYDELPAQQVG